MVAEVVVTAADALLDRVAPIVFQICVQLLQFHGSLLVAGLYPALVRRRDVLPAPAGHIGERETSRIVSQHFTQFSLDILSKKKGLDLPQFSKLEVLKFY